MNHILKDTARFAVCTCLTLGIVSAAAAAVTCSNVGRLVTAGFKGTKSAVKEELEKHKDNSTSREEREDASNE